MATVLKVNPDDPIDVVIRKFNRMVAAEMILPELRERQHYTKPSRRRYLKKKEVERQKRRRRKWPAF